MTITSNVRENGYAAPAAHSSVPPAPSSAEPQPAVLAMWPGRVLASLLLGSSSVVLGLVPLTLQLRLIKLTWPVAAPFAAMMVYGAVASVLGLVLMMSYKRASWAILGRRLVSITVLVSIVGLGLAASSWVQWASSLHR